MSIIEIEAEIREMRQLLALIAEVEAKIKAEAEIKAIKDKIKAEMGETETLLFQSTTRRFNVA